MSAIPKRIQRKRTKGWKMPENTVYVGRPTQWGNPFTIAHEGTATRAVCAYQEWLAARDADLARSGRPFAPFNYSENIKRELRGKDLACWCPLDQPCHADVLLEVANK